MNWRVSHRSGTNWEGRIRGLGSGSSQCCELASNYTGSQKLLGLVKPMPAIVGGIRGLGYLQMFVGGRKTEREQKKKSLKRQENADNVTSIILST